VRRVGFDTGILGRTISLTDGGTLVGDVKSSGNALDDDTKSLLVGSSASHASGRQELGIKRFIWLEPKSLNSTHLDQAEVF
jgi:hypothetical protein